MIRIDDTLVSLDVVERLFVCDPVHCKGLCCVEGDSGAPLEPGEPAALERALPEVWDELSLQAREVIRKQGVAYIDQAGETVTSIVQGKDCVFTCYDPQGVCHCAIEKAYRAGRIVVNKPISCHLYPIRVTQYKDYRALNFDKWKVCRAAETRGRAEGVPVYKFLKEPLIRKFGQAWYENLSRHAEEWNRQKDG